MNSSRLLRAGAVFHWTPTTWADAYRDFEIAGTPDIRGGRASLDGLTDYLSIPLHRTKKLHGSSAITVLAFVKMNSVSSATAQRLFRLYVGSANAVGPELYFASGNMYIGGRSGSGDSYQTSAAYSFSEVGKKASIAAIFDFANDKLEAYVDGTRRINSIVSFTGTSLDKSNTTKDLISPIISSVGVNCELYDLVFFPRALSATEISNISRGDPFPYLRNIVSLWKPAANGALIDVIGGNDGTPVNIDASNVVDGPWGRKVLSLNGSDENEITGNASSLVFDNSSQFSFGCAVKWKGAPSGNYPQIIDVGDLTGSNRNYLLGTWLNTRELFVEFMDISGFPNWRYFRTGILLDDNGWNIVLVSWSASGLGSTKYLNVYVFKLSGLSTYSTSTTYNWISGNGYASIGKSISNSTFFKGDVLSPFVARSAITQLEAADIYNRIMDGVL